MTVQNISKLADALIAKVISGKQDTNTNTNTKVASVVTSKVIAEKKAAILSKKVESAETLRKLASQIKTASKNNTLSNITYQDIKQYVNLFSK